MSLRDHLHAIKDKHGRLTPALVVEEASNPRHELHGRFEWDDSVAGDAWRKEQARQLIKSVYVTYRKSDGENVSIREFYAVRESTAADSDPGKYAFNTLDELKADPLTLEIVRRDLERDWRSLRAKYEAFEDFWVVIGADMPALVG